MSSQRIIQIAIQRCLQIAPPSCEPKFIELGDFVQENFAKLYDLIAPTFQPEDNPTLQQSKILILEILKAKPKTKELVLFCNKLVQVLVENEYACDDTITEKIGYKVFRKCYLCNSWTGSDAEVRFCSACGSRINKRKLNF